MNWNSNFLEVIFDIFDRFGEFYCLCLRYECLLEVIFDIFDRFGMQTRPSGGERPALEVIFDIFDRFGEPDAQELFWAWLTWK